MFHQIYIQQSIQLRVALHIFTPQLFAIRQ